MGGIRRDVGFGIGVHGLMLNGVILVWLSGDPTLSVSSVIDRHIS